jgi:ATP-dependent helicase HrpA
VLPADAFTRSALPPHLVSRIVVVGPDGRELASGRDLPALQRELAPDGPSAVSSGPGAARWQRTAVRQWDFGDLPVTATVPQRPVDLVLYPCLVDEHGRVDLALLPPGAAAVEQHRRGTRRLLLKCLPQQTALIREQTLADRELVLSYHGIGRSSDLVDDLLCASADASFDIAEPIRTQAAFESCLAAGRAELVAAADGLRPLLRRVLAAYRAVRGSLAAPAAAADERARAAITAQIDALVAARFLSDTPQEWRNEVPRYLAAALQRWQKLPQRRAKDAELEAQLQRTAQRLDDWVARQPVGWPWPAPIVRYRWLLEEFRVSLFAQTLGTAAPVSEKRLEEHWRQALEDRRGLSTAARAAGSLSARTSGQ